MDFLQVKKQIIESIGTSLDKVEKVDIFADMIISAGLLAKSPSASKRAGRRAGKIFVVGSGRSGLIIECFAQRLRHMGLNVHIVGEILQPSASKGDLLIVASGSGESVFPASIAQKAKKIGMKLILVTAERGSTIAKISDLIIYIPAPSKVTSSKMRNLQPLGSLFEQCLLIFCDAVVAIIQKTKNISSQTIFKNHTNLE